MTNVSGLMSTTALGRALLSTENNVPLSVDELFTLVQWRKCWQEFVVRGWGTSGEHLWKLPWLFQAVHDGYLQSSAGLFDENDIQPS